MTPKNKQTNREFHDARGALDAIWHDTLLLDAEQRGECDAPAVWADKLAATLRAEIAHQRQAEIAAAAPPPRLMPVTIPARVQAMSRGELEAQLAALRLQAGPSLQVAYRNLEQQTEGDLRILVAMLEQSGDEKDPTP